LRAPAPRFDYTFLKRCSDEASPPQIASSSRSTASTAARGRQRIDQKPAIVRDIVLKPGERWSNDASLEENSRGVARMFVGSKPATMRLYVRASM